MQKLQNIIARMAGILVILATMGAIGITLYIILAISGALFRFEVPDELLIVAEAMVFIVFLPQAFVVSTNGQVQVDVFASALSGKIQIYLDGLSRMFGIIFYALLVWAAWEAFQRSWLLDARHMASFDAPEWISRGVLLIGVLGGLVAQIHLLIKHNN